MMTWRAISSNGLGRGLAISLALHALVAVALLVSLPAPEADRETPPPAIEVAIVAPPEPEPPAEEPDPPQAEAEPDPPEPEATEPDPAEPEAAQAPPPANPAAGETPPEAARAVPIPVLRPVFQFGERDAGPREALDGNSAEDRLAALEPDETAADPPAADAPGEDTTDLAPEPAADSVPDPALAPGEQSAGVSLPEIELPDAALSPPTLGAPTSDVPGSPALAAAPDPEENLPGALPPDGPSADAQGDAGTSAAVAPAGELAEARQLFSPVLTENTAAMVAMGSLPRAVRASQLCTTELREQLRRAAPPYRPELLPSYGLDSGNVLSVGDAAFRAEGVWYDLSFRCTVDDDAFKVSAFAFSVGEAIPRDQWQARGFPNF